MCSVWRPTPPNTSGRRISWNRWCHGLTARLDRAPFYCGPRTILFISAVSICGANRNTSTASCSERFPAARSFYLVADDGTVLHLSSAALGFVAGYSTDFLFNTIERVCRRDLSENGQRSQGATAKESKGRQKAGVAPTFAPARWWPSAARLWRRSR